MYNINTKHNYKLETEIVTIQEAMDEMCMTLEEIKDCFGNYNVCFVRAVLYDEDVSYMQRLFAGVYAHTFLAYAQATQQITLELLEDYFEHCKSIEQK